MSAETVYDEIRDLVKQHVSPEVDGSTLERLTLVVAGMIHADHAAPARIARAIEQLGLSAARPESIERRIRRFENDAEVSAALCFHPLARAHLCWSQPQELLLIIDPTTQDDRVVMVSVAVWYRGRALPLAWAIWPGNKLLEGLRFWERIDALLELVASLLPDHVPVTWLADRAFGAALFIDLLTKRHWHYVLRVQDQTVSRDSQGREKPLRQLVRLPGQRRKLRGEVFKKRGWRPCHVVAYWGRRHKSPLCLISDLGAHWYLIRLYRRRYPIEATFRDYKSSGWQWEQGQVTHLDHLERLLVGMALATWIALMTGTQVAAEYLAQPPTGRRRTMPPQGKHSLFQLGLSRLQKLLVGSQSEPLAWRLTDWDAPNWREQIHFHHAYAFIFAWR
jgi:Transposase DDE domain